MKHLVKEREINICLKGQQKLLGISISQFVLLDPRNTRGEKSLGGIQLSTAQSRKSGDAATPGGKVAARGNIRRSSSWPNMLSIWQNPRQDKKSLPSGSKLFRLADQMRCRNLNVQGGKPVHNDAGEVCLNEGGQRAMQAAGKEHYECLSNVGFDWKPDSPHKSISWKARPPDPTWAGDQTVAKLLVHPWS